MRRPVAFAIRGGRTVPDPPSDVESPLDRTPSRVAGAVMLLPWAWLTWTLWFVCDDAYITFRYSRHWAEGLGPRFNVGDLAPVEGYSNFLWMAVAAAVERLGASPVTVLPVISAACGAALLLAVGRAASRHFGLGVPGVLAATGLLGLSPAFAAWSTGGLATMPLALTLFVVFERLVLSDDARAWRHAAVAAVALALLRTEGPAWVVVVATLAAGVRWLRRDTLSTAWWQPPARVLAVVAPIVAVHVGWRWSYYGDVVSNTARAKVGLSADRLLRGGKYVLAVTVNLVTPVLGLLGVVAAGRRWPLGLGVLTMALAVPAYAVAIGGDYMAFGRMLVPGLPYLALLLGLFVDRAAWRLAPVLVVLGLGVLPGLGIELAPADVQQALRYRQNFKGLQSEHASWQFMARNGQIWSTEGRILAAGTEPGESLVTGAIGARGYHCELVILDRGGLVIREVNEIDDHHPALQASPGHDRIVPRSFFLPWEPTYLDFDIEPGGTSATRLAKKARAFGTGRWKDGYAPVVRKVSVDERSWYLLLLARQDSPADARSVWERLNADVAAVTGQPLDTLSAPLDDDLEVDDTDAAED